MRPFIGITCSSDPDGHPQVNPRYVRAVLEHGGLPVPLPWVADEGAAHALLEANPRPTKQEAREALAWNLCRCAGYEQITEAVLAAASLAGKTG